MGVLPLGQGLIVVFLPVRRRYEHPHQQLTRFDRRVVAVLQQHGPLYRADQETLSQLVIDNPFDLVTLGPFHRASTPLSPRLTSQRRGSHDGSGRGMSVVSAGMSW